MTRVRLDRVRTDVLLWALGGFADKPAPSTHPRGYQDHEIRQIAAIAALPRAPHGTVAALAERLGRDVKTLRVVISKTRHGHVPASWATGLGREAPHHVPSNGRLAL